MIELPEATTLARQMREALPGKTVARVTVLHTPHKWAWFHGDPSQYPARLVGRTVVGAEATGGMVEIALGDTSLLLYDGPVVRYVPPGADVPARHQLLLGLADGSHLVARVGLYGGFACFAPGTFQNRYYLAAGSAPSPLTEAFTLAHLRELLAAARPAGLSAKHFLATEQRIPGLGNGVLQDILHTARIHPRRRMDGLDEDALPRLHTAIRQTLQEMTRLGGRDTEPDLYGQPGGYPTRFGRHTVGKPCPSCHDPIQKASFAGGSVYYCARCQPL